MTSFYETLEVSPRASHIVIRAAYRCLAQSDHPDKHSDAEDAGQRMSRINRAYAVLSDHEKRREYDLSQGIPRGFCERRGLGALSPAQGQSPGKGPPHRPTLRLSPSGLTQANSDHTCFDLAAYADHAGAVVCYPDCALAH